MINKIILTLAIFFISFLSWAFCGYQAKAQTIGIKVSPVRLEDIVDPGEVLNEKITVTNQSEVPKILYPYLRDFKAEDETGTPKLIIPGSESGYYLASWIEINTEGINFQPGEERTIDYKIKVPANTGPGGYFGAIVFGTEPPKLFQQSEDKGAGMAIAQQTGSLVLLRVKGDVFEEARIREFKTDKGIYGTPYDVEFLIRIENVGNVHVKPYGNIHISNMFNREVAVIAVNDRGSNILPKSIRRFTIDWAGKAGFGKYTVSLGLSYGTKTDLGGQGKQTLYTELSFWIIPWKIVIPALISLVVLITLAYLFLRFYKSKAVRRAMQQMGLGQMRYVSKFQGPSPYLHFSVILLTLLAIAFLVGVVSYFLFFA